MIKKLPNKVKIGGFTYKIVTKDTSETEHTLGGLHSLSTLEITIFLYVRNRKRPLPLIHQTLLHEIFHAINEYYDVSLNEVQVDQLASGWYDVLKNNNIEWNNVNKIPKKVKVGGYTYRVDYPHCFSDDTGPFYSCTLNDLLTIFIGDGSDDEKYNPQIIKNALCRGITSAILFTYFGNGDKNKLDQSVQARLSNGTYQVLVDNPAIEKMVKNEKKER